MWWTLYTHSYYYRKTDVVKGREKEVPLQNNTRSGKSVTHLFLSWEACTVINNGRRIPAGHKGESQRVLVCVCICKITHKCCYMFSMWASITTSRWIIQRYKIKKHPSACWNINGLINDGENVKLQSSAVTKVTSTHFFKVMLFWALVLLNIHVDLP